MTALSMVVVALMASIPVSAGIVWLIGKDESGLRAKESKTPYDYALTNAINERDRLQDELRTIRALKRTEADTERIRNEIVTILSDDGEEASEGVYEPNIGMPIQDNGDGTFSPIKWDILLSGIVREDDTKDEQLTEDDVERSYLELIDKAIHSEQKVLCIYRSNAGEGLNGNELAVGTIVNFRYHNGQTRYLTLRVRHSNQRGTYIMHIRGEDLDEVSLLGGETHGEIIYRKETI